MLAKRQSYVVRLIQYCIVMAARQHMDRRTLWWMIISGLFGAAFFQGCTDAGSPVTPDTQPNGAVIIAIRPDSAGVGDTIAVSGTAFGKTQGSSIVQVGGAPATIVVAWSDTLVRVVVPGTAVNGIVVVSVNGVSSNSKAFALRGAGAFVSFSRDILPIFSQKGCASCHGGSGGLFVGSVAQLLQGGDHGPAIVPGNADASHIVQKLSPTPPFGSRMPLGGPYLTTSTIQTIKDWINQGALNN